MDKWNKVKKLRSLEILGEAPQEASANLQAPETSPYDKRITGRTKPLSLKATPEFHKELKRIATEKECLMIEVLEKALEVYKGGLNSKNKSVSSVKHERQQQESKVSSQIKPKPKTPSQSLNQFWKVNFTCDKCYQRFEKGIVFSLAPNLDQIDNYPTYCSNCKETIEIPETCSFRERNEQANQYTSCDKPLFDKKKQLCRSHNRQVRNKFNEFTKDMSVSSMTAWEMQWEQSGDWRYFWGLGEDGE